MGAKLSRFLRKAFTGDRRHSDKKREDEKRKREEEESRSKEIKKRRGEKVRALEDEVPRAGTSQDPETYCHYPNFNISHFNIHQVLGSGSFGKVVLASFPGRETFIAVKVIKKREDNAHILQREREILLTARDCPFLCHLYATHQSRDRAYFITEYLSGGSLEALIKMSGRLNIHHVRFYTAEIVCGLQFLHRHNIVHQDLKPENIMLDGDGHIRIIDLGLAQDGVTPSNKTRGVMGTLRFMAPEVLLGKEYDAAVDWWSLGIVVSMMSTGHSPFYNGHVVTDALDSIIRARPKLPFWLEAGVKDLIMKLLRKDPEMRLGVYRNIRHHPFFNTIGWEDLEQRRVQPPFVPFKAALENKHLQWPEDKMPLHPVAGFSFISPSMAWMIRRFRL